MTLNLSMLEPRRRKSELAHNSEEASDACRDHIQSFELPAVADVCSHVKYQASIARAGCAPAHLCSVLPLTGSTYEFLYCPRPMVCLVTQH